MLENRVAKVAILQAKLAEVEQKIEKEQSLMENVQKVMPVKIEQNNANDSAASAAIANAVAELEAYYSIDFDGNGYEGTIITFIASAQIMFVVIFSFRSQPMPMLTISCGNVCAKHLPTFRTTFCGIICSSRRTCN